MEIKINSEIKDVKERVYFGLDFRQMACLVIGLFFGTLVFVSLYKKIDISYISVLSCLVSVPFFLIGFLKRQNMDALTLMREYIRSYILIDRELLHRPYNRYKEYMKEIEYNSVENRKKRKRKRVFLVLSIFCVFLVFTALMITGSFYLNRDHLVNTRTESIEKIENTYREDLALLDRDVRDSLLSDLSDEISSAESETDMENTVRKYENLLSGKYSKYQSAASLFLKYWNSNEYVKKDETLPYIAEKQAQLIKIRDDTCPLSIKVFKADRVMKDEIRKKYRVNLKSAGAYREYDKKLKEGDKNDQ